MQHGVWNAQSRRDATHLHRCACAAINGTEFGILRWFHSSVRLARISGELADIFPHYRDFSFFVARQELVIVDSQSYGIVGFVPISGGGTLGTAPPREETGVVGTAAPPAPAKKALRTEKKRVTVTEEKPRAMERETIPRSPAHTETDVPVGASRRDTEELDELPPRDRRLGPPVRERVEHYEGPRSRSRSSSAGRTKCSSGVHPWTYSNTWQNS